MVLVPTSHSKNKKGYAFLAFCNNDKGILNGAATPVCLYTQQWHRLDHVEGRPHLGRQICEVHQYIVQLEDTLEQQEEEEPKSTKEESSEDETQQQVNQQIRLTPITPTLQFPTMSTTITQATYTRVNDDLGNTDDHPGKPTTSSKCISGSLHQFLRCTGPPGGGGPPGDDPDEWEHSGRQWAGGGPPGSCPPGGGPPGGAGPRADLIPIAVAGDVKTMGSLPQILTGNRTRADDFIEEVRGYLCLNQVVAGFNSPMKKVSLTLTLVKGPEVAGWV